MFILTIFGCHPSQLIHLSIHHQKSSSVSPFHAKMENPASASAAATSFCKYKTKAVKNHLNCEKSFKCKNLSVLKQQGKDNRWRDNRCLNLNPLTKNNQVKASQNQCEHIYNFVTVNLKQSCEMLMDNTDTDDDRCHNATTIIHTTLAI